MVQYRRNWLPGGTYFFTVTLADRSSTLLVDRVDALRDATRKTRDAMPFEIVAAVVMQNHLHSLWTLPERDADYATRWRLLKTHSTKSLGIATPWQRRYWEHAIRNEQDLANNIDYIHINPVKHGYVTRASDWPHSSIHRYIAEGFVSSNWAADIDVVDIGEPSEH
jgi:putative transposase